MEFLNFIKAKIKLYNNILEWFPFLGCFVTKRNDSDKNAFFWLYQFVIINIIIWSVIIFLLKVKIK